MHDAVGSFGWKLGKEFVVSIELAPPRGVNPTKLLAGAHMLREKGIDAVNVTDSALGRASMSALAVCYLVTQEVGLNVIPHFTTRDRTLMGIQAELLGAHAMGLRHILALTGDAPNPVEKMGSSAVFDIEFDRADQAAHQAEPGRGHRWEQHRRHHGLPHWVRVQPDRAGPAAGDRPIGTEAGGGGALRDDAAGVRPGAGGPHAGAREAVPTYPVLMGILPLQSYRHAEFLHNEVPGIVIPEFVLARMYEAGANGRQAGVEMAQELLLHAATRYAGAYLMPSFGRYELCASVLDVLPRFAPSGVEASSV